MRDLQSQDCVKHLEYDCFSGEYRQVELKDLHTSSVFTKNIADTQAVVPLQHFHLSSLSVKYDNLRQRLFTNREMGLTTPFESVRDVWIPIE